MEHCRHFSNLVPNFQIRIFKFLLKSPSLQTLFSSHTQILSSKTFPFNLFIQSLLFIPVYLYPFTLSKSKTILRYNLIHGPLFVGYSILIVPIILVPGCQSGHEMSVQLPATSYLTGFLCIYDKICNIIHLPSK